MSLFVRYGLRQKSHAITLPGGLRVSFVQGRKPQGQVLAGRDLARIESVDDLLRAVAGQRSDTVKIQNKQSVWLRIASLAIKASIPDLVVWQPPAVDESLTDERRVMRADESDLCYLPNYKCGYASIRNLFLLGFESYATDFKSNTGRLDRKESASRIKSDFIFSVVRDPVSRFKSFYLDKFCRPDDHHNHKDWKQLYASLLGQDFDCRALLQFVRKVPSAFSDYHWKSMAENLYHGERLLVQRIYTIEKLDQLTNDLSRYVGRDLILRHHLKTSAIDAHDIRAEVSRLAPEIEQAYAADVELYDAVEQAGGVLTNVR